MLIVTVLTFNSLAQISPVATISKKCGMHMKSEKNVTNLKSFAAIAFFLKMAFKLIHIIA